MEEGEIVYFETSPAAEQLRETATNYSAEHIFSLTSSYTPTDLHSRTSSESKPSRFASIIQALNNTVAPIETKEYYIRKMMCMIQDSALLTDEDSQVLDFVVPKKEEKDRKEQDEWREAGWLTSWPLTCAVVIGVLAVLVVTPAGGWWSGGGVGGMVTCVLVMVKLVRRRNKLSIQHQSHQLQQYLVTCERLLSLLTQCLRCIQEHEVVYSGYDRLSQGVPVTRLDTADKKYQCHPLRRRVLTVCQRGVELMASCTRSLVQQYHINEELNYRQQYLAFCDLSNIHDALVMKTEEEEWVDNGRCEQLSLESLRKAANILAVQNSELLKRMAVVFHYHGLWPCSEMVQPLLLVVSESESELKWGLEYQRNYLLESPRSQTITTNTSSSSSFSSTSSSSTSSTSPPSQTQLVSLELHCADLHAMAALKRIRDTEKCVSQDQLQLVLSSLMTAADHTRAAIDLLRNRREDQHEQEPSKEEEEEEEEGERQEQDEQTSGPDLHEQEGTDSDIDEMVFEAYASISDEESRMEDEPHAIDFKEQRESSAQMLRELHSVLAVRKTAREERREKRKRDQRATPLHTSSTMPDDMQHDTLDKHHASETDMPSTPSQPTENSDRTPSPQHTTPFSNITIATALSQVLAVTTKPTRRQHEEEVCGEGEKEPEEAEEERQEQREAEDD